MRIIIHIKNLSTYYCIILPYISISNNALSIKDFYEVSNDKTHY